MSQTAIDNGLGLADTRLAQEWFGFSSRLLKKRREGRLIPAEVDPVNRDRLRVALEEPPRQRNLEVPVLER